MSAIPTLNIPITVQTEQVPKALAKVEKDITSSAKRMESKMGSIGRAAPGALKMLGIGGPGIGALARLGVGGGGLALGAAPFVAARGFMSAFEGATAGATEALRKFRETGENSFGANSAILKALSEGEQWAKQNKTLGLGQAFAAGMQGVSGQEESTLQYYARTLSDFTTQASAFLGAVVGGGTGEQALQQARLSTAAEWQVPEIQRQMRQSAVTPGTDFISQPLTYAADAFIENSKILQWLIQKSI